MATKQAQRNIILPNFQKKNRKNIQSQDGKLTNNQTPTIFYRQQ